MGIDKPPIRIKFTPNNIGRVIINIDVRKADGLSHKNIVFKLDSGSDFTTISIEDLQLLGFKNYFLSKCPKHILPENQKVTTADGTPVKLQYINNMSMMFEDREILNVRLFFAMGTNMRSLFGSDILKYFNSEVNYDIGYLSLYERSSMPDLSNNEVPLQIYELKQI